MSRNCFSPLFSRIFEKKQIATLERVVVWGCLTLTKLWSTIYYYMLYILYDFTAIESSFLNLKSENLKFGELLSST